MIGRSGFQVPALARKTGLKITSIESFVQGTNPGIVRAEPKTVLKDAANFRPMTPTSPPPSCS